MYLGFIGITVTRRGPSWGHNSGFFQVLFTQKIEVLASESLQSNYGRQSRNYCPFSCRDGIKTLRNIRMTPEITRGVHNLNLPCFIAWIEWHKLSLPPVLVYRVCSDAATNGGLWMVCRAGTAARSTPVSARGYSRSPRNQPTPMSPPWGESGLFA